MTRYADPGRCPDCAHPIDYADLACPGCGLPLRGLTAQRLYQTLSEADALLVSLRAEAARVELALRREPVGAGVGAAGGPVGAPHDGLEGIGLAAGGVRRAARCPCRGPPGPRGLRTA